MIVAGADRKKVLAVAGAGQRRILVIVAGADQREILTVAGSRSTGGVTRGGRSKERYYDRAVDCRSKDTCNHS